LMRSFLMLAETGSVTLAAARIGRTQSAISMQLRRLEESLGQSLFERRPRGLVLTARGAQLLPYAERVVHLLDEAAVSLRERPLQGPLRVGIPEDYGESVLPRALAGFATRHPGVEVSVRCDYSVPQMAALEADLLDLAVVFESGDATKGEVICVDPTVWVSSVTHEQHLCKPLPVANYFHSGWCKEYAMAALDRSGVDYRVAFECDTSGGMQIAVRSGLAIAPLSRSTIPAGCRELTQEDGFGVVDASSVVLYLNPRGASEAARGLAAELRAAFRPLEG
jgi:DNA-binding transcriptional LysR family regulator